MVVLRRYTPLSAQSWDCRKTMADWHQNDRRYAPGREPERRPRRSLKTFIAILIVAALVAMGVVLLVNQLLFVGLDSSSSEMVFEIRPGQGLRTVSVNLANAGVIRQTMTDLGFDHVGGDNSPYIWIDGNGRDSWEFFDLLLDKAGVVCTPGGGFGRCGAQSIRISAFNSPENVAKAMARLKDVLK